MFMKVIQLLLFKDSSVSVCHLVSIRLNISSGNAANAKVNIKLNTVQSRSIHTKQRIESVSTNLHNDTFATY